MKNQLFTGTQTSPRFAKCPSNIKPGDMVLIGKLPACSLNGYQANEGGGTFYFNGTFQAPVAASSSHSPLTPAALKPGDPLYASGTYDATTNVTYALFISGTTTDTPFGELDASFSAGIGAGVVNTFAPIRIGG